MSKFVQTIEFRTTRPDRIQQLLDEWAAATEGRRTSVTGLMCVDREDGHFISLIEFPSYEAAMENSELPETRALAERMAELCLEPPIFHDLDVVYREPIGPATGAAGVRPRMVADCREMPSDVGCTLTISGREDEVLEAATQHAVIVHGHEDTPELRSQIRAMLKDEEFTLL